MNTKKGKKGVPASRSASPGLRPKKTEPWLRDLLTAGACLSNIAFNLEQTSAPLPDGYREVLGRWRLAWDAAIRRYALSAKRGGAKRSRPKSSPSKRGAT